jgi:hypothetical protein
MVNVRLKQNPVVRSSKKQKSRATPYATVRPRNSAKKKYQNQPAKSQSGISVLSGPWQLNTVIVLLCILATATLYAGDLHLGFFRIDDPQYVVGDPWIKGITLEYIKHILTSPYYLNYSPLHLLSYMLDYSVVGSNAYAFHLSSNLWAGMVAGLVYLVALALTRQRLTAVAAALLFVVHPLHVEAVAWISSRKDLVAAALVLPSFLTYLKYRQSEVRSWYIISFFLFLFALLGKLSVAAFPVVLLAVDMFIEKRPLSRSIADKIPFFILAALVGLAVALAQPSTGLQPDVAIRAKAFAESGWLLTGLGNYVLYRVPPASGGNWLQFGAVIILIGLLFLPLLLRKRHPLATVLIYWVLFTYLPTQVLSFSYPVTDRYLFLPSVGACILIAWLIVRGAAHLRKWNLAAATVLVAVISSVWAAKTVKYLSEWRDPRSVWFAAKTKSNDFHVYYELGSEYLEKLGSLGIERRNAPLPVEEAKRYASVVWKDDPRLPQLLSELSNNQHNGPSEGAFKAHLQAEAARNFDEAALRKEENIVPDLFVSRGVLFLDKGDLQSAKKEFLAARDEASGFPYSEGRQEVLIWCYYDLAVTEGKLAHFKEALSWIKLAEEEQDKLGRTVIPELTANRQKLESTMATLPPD